MSSEKGLPDRARAVIVGGGVNGCSISAHADADELIRWAAGFTKAPRQVFVVHGEPQPADTLRSRLGREFGWQATVPRPGQVFGL